MTIRQLKSRSDLPRPISLMPIIKLPNMFLEPVIKVILEFPYLDDVLVRLGLPFMSKAREMVEIAQELSFPTSPLTRMNL